MRMSFGPEDEAFRAELVAFLDEHTPPEAGGGADFMGEFHGDELVPQWLRQWQATLFDHGWMIPGYPPELGGRNCTPVQTLIYLEELASRRHPAVGATSPATRSSRRACSSSATTSRRATRAGRDPRRHGLVHRHERAQRRLRPRRAPDPRRGRRRPLRRQRPEGVDVLRHDRPEVLLLRAHRPDVAEAQGHHAAHRRHGHAGHRGPAAAPHHRRRRTSPRCSSPTSMVPRRQPRRASSTAAGASRRARSRTSGPACGSRGVAARADRRTALVELARRTAAPTTRSCAARSPQAYERRVEPARARLQGLRVVRPGLVGARALVHEDGHVGAGQGAVRARHGHPADRTAR